MCALLPAVAMLANNDKISKPAKGRFFGLSVAELLGLVRALNFAHSDYRRRVDIALLNPGHDSPLGLPLAAYAQRDWLWLFSFPDGISSIRAKALDEAVLREFARLDAQPAQSYSRLKMKSFWAYLGHGNKIIVTERLFSWSLPKYRGGAKFSNAFKPKAIRIEESPLFEIDAA